MTLQETTWVATTRLRIANNRLEVVLNREDYNRLGDLTGGTIRLRPRVLDRGLVLWLRPEATRRVGVYTVWQIAKTKRTDQWAKVLMSMDAADLATVARWFDLATYKDGVTVRFRVEGDELIAIRDGEGDLPPEVTTPPERLGITAEMETGPGRNYPVPVAQLSQPEVVVVAEDPDGLRQFSIPVADWAVLQGLLARYEKNA